MPPTIAGINADLEACAMKRLSELHDVNSDPNRLRTETRSDSTGRVGGSLIPLSIDQDAVRLRETVDQLNESLEKANRRIHRLLGEKKQLANLLDKRDSQLERLQRELGASVAAKGRDSARNDGILGLSHQLRAAIEALTERVRFFLGERNSVRKTISGNDRVDLVANTGNKHQGLVSRRKGHNEQSVVAILLFGLTRNEVEQLLPIIERDCSAKGVSPLCLIDIDAFELLRSRGLIFEYLPSSGDQDQFDPTLNWDLYTQRRLSLIRRKWDPVRLVAFGAVAMETLKLWSSSPFEDAPLPTASNSLPV